MLKWSHEYRNRPVRTIKEYNDEEATQQNKERCCRIKILGLALIIITHLGAYKMNNDLDQLVSAEAFNITEGIKRGYAVETIEQSLYWYQRLNKTIDSLGLSVIDESNKYVKMVADYKNSKQ